MPKRCNKRELYRRIRDSGLKVVTLEDVREFCFLKKDPIVHSDQAVHRLVERLKADGLIEATNVRGVYLPVSEFV